MVLPVKMTSMKTLVRYVDKDQAVIEAQLVTSPAWSSGDDTDLPPVEVQIEITGADGFHDESRTPLCLTAGTGTVRFEMVQPDRWWPAGMGKQPLYEIMVRLLVDDEVVDQRTVTLGLTSVRRMLDADEDAEASLLVNGQVCDIHSVVMVDRVDENQLLPATGDSLLLVRDHYGPDVLYQAADRAGILLLQCVPIHPEATPEVDVAAEVDRLATHPSLAGWFVGHLGQISDSLARRIQILDPTRSVFREVPEPNAA